jgi:hypothetical protein
MPEETIKIEEVVETVVEQQEEPATIIDADGNLVSTLDPLSNSNPGVNQ